MRMKRIRTFSLRIMLSLLALFTCAFLLHAAENPESIECGDQGYIECLEAHSMLYQASRLAKMYSGQGTQWRHPYADPQPKKATKIAPVWFTAYPAAIITRPKQTVLQTLGDETLWETFERIGIRAVHTGPLKRAGGIADRRYTQSVDGGFDRISLDIDPSFGTEEEYIKMAETAKAHGAYIVGDIVPGHTGKGPDFRLAEKNYKDYPGIYHMIEIKREDWRLLPEVPDGEDSVNLSCDTVKKLKEKEYIVGALERVIFYEPKVKETNWSATDRIIGVDGVERRWVYLHYFKSGEPTLNWLDPSFAAQRLVVGDIIKSRKRLGAKILRLDANGFLGIEERTYAAANATASSGIFHACENQQKAWSEGHPLSIVSNEEITMLMRKLSGFTFQELNLTLEDIKAFSQGADLSYDFVTRPAFAHALITGSARFLRLMMRLMHEYEIRPLSLIHGLQNHDEVTYELVHFANNKDTLYPYGDEKIRGQKLADEIRKEAYESVAVTWDELEKAKTNWWNIVGWNGICGTMTGIIAAALGIEDPYHMDDEQKEDVKKAHLLMVMFNAMQPGVLAISGWDLVGALPLDAKAILQGKEGPVKDLLKDRDCRWLNRGAYDLMGNDPDATQAPIWPFLPKAEAIYGTLPEQLRDQNSFVSRLKRMLEIREKYDIHLSDQVPSPTVKNDGVVLMIHQPNNRENWTLQITAINFGKDRIQEILKMEEVFKDKEGRMRKTKGLNINDLKGLSALNLLTMQDEGKIDESGELAIELGPREGKILLFRS